MTTGNEIVYSPASPHVDELFRILEQFVVPSLTITSVENSEELESRLTEQNSFVGVEFPDDYAVSDQHDILFCRFCKAHNCAFRTCPYCLMS